MQLSHFPHLALLATCTLASPLPSSQSPESDPMQCPDLCAGTNASSSDTYICSDPRLGPKTLPTALPLASIAGQDSTYHRLGGLCPAQFLATYTNATTGAFLYPPFAGYQLTTLGKPAMYNLTLEPGTLLDRFGSEYGQYMSPAGTPYAQRSLPPANLDAAPGAAYPFNYRVYTVTKSFTVQGGLIAGWFGQQGLGVQFFMPSSVMKLVDDGYLGRVNLTAYSES